MEKVYVLCYGDPESWKVESVFASKEHAERVKDIRNQDCSPWDGYWVEEHSLIYHPFKFNESK